VLCAVATAAVAALPSLRLAYGNSALKIALETTATLAAIVTSYLLLGRVQRTRLLDELVLACGLTLLAFSDFVSAILAAVGTPETETVTWEPLIGTAAAAIVITVASLLPRREISLSAKGARRIVFAVASAFVMVILVVVIDPGGFLPESVFAAASTAASRPRLVDQPALVSVQLFLALVYALAAVGFARRSSHDELSGWLAVASILGCAARVNYVIYPSTHTMWLYTGDLFRLGFYVALLIGAAREIASYWAANVVAAQLEERRRIARDLHDGLAQEIAFIGRNAALLREEGDDPEIVDRIIAAAERARLESRSVIGALTARLDQPLDRALIEAAEEAEIRYGASVSVKVPQLVILPPARREALLRIATEAIANAARHSGAREVRVELERQNGGTLLRIVDNGRGFDPDTRPGSGFGLISMRERAEAIGGSLQIRSHPGAGTRVEVLV
jgi:signal transduction histidine kinase